MAESGGAPQSLFCGSLPRLQGHGCDDKVYPIGVHPAVTRADADRVRLSARPGRGRIVRFFSVMQYPGWTSTVDGQKAELVPADIAFYAVPLGAGTHRVELVYHSRGLFYGSWIATVTGLLALGLAGWYARTRQACAT